MSLLYKPPKKDIRDTSSNLEHLDISASDCYSSKILPSALKEGTVQNGLCQEYDLFSIAYE